MELERDDAPSPHDMWVWKIIGDALYEEYPSKYVWMVGGHDGAYWVQLRDMKLALALQTGKQHDYGFWLFEKNFATVSEMKAWAIRAGGELLERANLPRHTYNDDPIFKVDMG